MNGPRYVEMQKDKLILHISMHRYEIDMHGGASLKVASELAKKKKVCWYDVAKE